MTEKREVMLEAIQILKTLDKQDQITINKYIDELAAQRTQPPPDPNKELMLKIYMYERLVKKIKRFCAAFTRRPREKKSRGGMLLMSIIYMIDSLEP